MSYYFIQAEQLRSQPEAPPNASKLVETGHHLTPPLISTLLTSLGAWKTFALSPGAIQPAQVWYQPDGTAIFYLARNKQPKALMQVGLAPDIAAWLVLLDHWMETYVVIARARTVFSVIDLAGALTFMTPAFLPPSLIDFTGGGWVRVAQALAIALADGPLTGSPQNRHWH